MPQVAGGAGPLPPVGEASPPATASDVATATGFLGAWLSEVAHAQHTNVRLLTEREAARSGACGALCAVIEDHLVGVDVLARMKFPRAAALLDARLPRGKRIRSGDLAEIIATEYVQQHTEFVVPLKRLRHKDDREMSMRGDDIVGLHGTGGQPAVLKAEVKSRAALPAAVVGEACASLESYRGRPKPETLGFLATHLRYDGRDAEAERLEDLLTTRLGVRDIAHLVFTLSGNDPATALASHAAAKRLIADRRLVGLRVADHQAFIRSVFDGVQAARQPGAPSAPGAAAASATGNATTGDSAAAA